MADATCVSTWSGFDYPALVIDAFRRAPWAQWVAAVGVLHEVAIRPRIDIVGRHRGLVRDLADPLQPGREVEGLAVSAPW